MVLFLYVIMMLNLNSEMEPVKNKAQKIAAVVSGGLLSLVLIVSLRKMELTQVSAPSTSIGQIQNLGKILFNEFLLPFEISSILLLSAMVGSVYLSKKSLSE